MIESDFWLVELLRKTKDLGGAHFSGIGVIVTDLPDNLPTIPLTDTVPPIDQGAVLAKTLSEIAQRSSRYHDGFHIISKSGDLKRVAQYFSPPVRTEFDLDRSKSVGGRYVAALFGSVLPDVEMTGIASNEFGIAVFKAGLEVFYEPAK